MASDNFEGVDGTTLTTHDPKWFQISDSTDTMEIQSNQAQVSSTWDRAGYRYVNGQPADHESEIEFAADAARVNNRDQGPAVRMQADFPGYIFRWTGEAAGSYTNWTVRRRIASGNTLIGAGSGSWSKSAPITVKLAVSGSAIVDIDVTINDVFQTTVSDADAERLTTGLPGIYVDANNLPANMRINRWTDNIGAPTVSIPAILSANQDQR